MIDTVRRTGHSSFYVEKGMSAMGKAPQHNDMPRVKGGGERLSMISCPAIQTLFGL